MALSLRDKLALAAKANLIQNAEMTRARLASMEDISNVLPLSEAAARVNERQELEDSVDETMSGQKVRPKGPAKRSGHFDRANGPSNWPDPDVRPKGPAKRSGQLAGQTGPSNWPDKMAGPLVLEMPSAWSCASVRTRQQRLVLDFLREHGSILISLAMFSKILDISEETLRKILRVLSHRGLIRKQKQANDGLVIEAVEVTVSGQKVRPKGPANWPDKMAAPLLPLKIDREKKDLSISWNKSLMELNWPNLAAAGFGPAQVEAVSAALVSAGRSLEYVRVGLDRAEWELEQGTMVDKNGAMVTDPASWVFRSLARTGTYRRPKGYVSPEEQAAHDAETEAQAIIEANHRADEKRFEAWRIGLIGEELEAAMLGYPGGSKERWLRTVWEKKKTECQH